MKLFRARYRVANIYSSLPGRRKQGYPIPWIVAIRCDLAPRFPVPCTFMGGALMSLSWPWWKHSCQADCGRGIWPLSLSGALTVLAIVGVQIPAQDFFGTPEEYIPLHSILEFVAIAVSAMVCGLGWNLRRQQNNSLSMVLASAFFAVAVVIYFR